LVGEHCASSIDGVQEIVRTNAKVRIQGRASQLPWSVFSPPRGDGQPDGAPLGTRMLRGIVEYSPQDQVVTLQAGMRVFELQNLLAEKKQCLPLGACGTRSLRAGSLGGALALNLPHLLEGTYGSWRDWVLGMKVVLADGRLVSCGSKVVKNVAGYDVQKLLIGSRGSLGVIVEVTLRTFPINALERLATPEAAGSLFQVAQRVRQSDLEKCVAGLGRDYSVDSGTGTVWFAMGEEEDPVRYEGDWVLRTLCGARNLQFSDPTHIRLMKRAKDIFDPTGKLNPGEMGMF
jgi:glycolate oxidase FAD binding subunit